MIVACEKCQTRFRVADEKLTPQGLRVRCSKCSHIFSVMPSPEETLGPAPAAAPAPWAADPFSSPMPAPFGAAAANPFAAPSTPAPSAPPA
ncbi:MAG: zinc-ribbon domain-containing protein, partial [Myxococcota bacterium]